MNHSRRGFFGRLLGGAAALPALRAGATIGDKDVASAASRDVVPIPVHSPGCTCESAEGWDNWCARCKCQGGRVHGLGLFYDIPEDCLLVSARLSGIEPGTHGPFTVMVDNFK